MQCPHCQHESSATRLKCSSCGQSYDRATLETLQYLQYTLAWLDERAEVLGPETLGQLRDEAQDQLQALRDELGLAPPRTAEETARELALVQCARDATRQWTTAFALTTGAARILRRYLSQRVEELETELVETPIGTQPVQDLDVLDFAIQSLPSWVENVPLRPASADILRQHLEQEREALLQSLALPPAPAPQLTPSVPLAAARSAGDSADPRSPTPKRDWASLLRWLLRIGVFIVVVGAALQGYVVAAVAALGFVALLAIWARRKT
jgi:hypothetical protein